MKNRVFLSVLIERINRFAPDLGGVFSFADLWNLIGLKSSDRTAKVLNRLVREGVLFKIRRGVYVTKEPDLWVLASRLKENSCISMDSVLAKNGLIGTVPAKSVSVAYPGNTQTVQTAFGRLRYFKIKKELIFGTVKSPNGVVTADSEKATIDLLYYYSKGARFVIDPLKDVDLWKLDLKKVQRYLRSYKNQKFRKFVEGLIHENV
jgi:predicted transcriptional regulator of viral defense system